MRMPESGSTCYEMASRAATLSPAICQAEPSLDDHGFDTSGPIRNPRVARHLRRLDGACPASMGDRRSGHAILGEALTFFDIERAYAGAIICVITDRAEANRLVLWLVQFQEFSGMAPPRRTRVPQRLQGVQLAAGSLSEAADRRIDSTGGRTRSPAGRACG